MPSKWTSRAIFDEFDRAYGVQKMTAHWGQQSIAEVERLWGEQLARFDDDVIGKALQTVFANGSSWPPSMPEFVSACREFNRPEHRIGSLAAIGYKPTPEEIARGERMIKQARARIKAPRSDDRDIGEPAPPTSIIGALQAGFKAEQKKVSSGKPNKQWAYLHMIQYANGADKSDTQIQMANAVCGLKPEQMEIIRGDRNLIKNGATA